MLAANDRPSTEQNNATVSYNFALGYLRGFVVVLVVAHHAMLAYHPYAPTPPASLIANPRWWQAFPVVDSQRWGPAYLLVDFNERFFMSLMFFLSGLFVWRGLTRKGIAMYLRDRLLRLGVPFLVAAAFFAPIAFYPAFLQIQGHAGVIGFRDQWLSLGQWPAGPAWFLWILLVFDCAAALLFRLAPKSGESLGRIASTGNRKPLRLFAALVAASAAAYVPLALTFTPLDWRTFGPFTLQTSRILLYLIYFLFGVAVGAYGLGRGLLASDGQLAKSWRWWVIGSLTIFAAATLVTIVAVTRQTTQLGWAAADDGGFALCCATSSFAFLSLFVHFFPKRVQLFDSLSANSYAIYIVHYGLVTWLQYALLDAVLPAAAKAALVFVGALALSWSVAATIRRIPAVARIV